MHVLSEFNVSTSRIGSSMAICWIEYKCHISFQFSSVAQSCPTLRPHEPQNTRPPCPSLTPRVYSNSSSHLILCHPLLLLPPIPPRNRVFSNESALCITWPNYWNFSFNISPSSKHSGLIVGWTGWISLQSKGLSRVFFNTTVQQHQFFGARISL